MGFNLTICNLSIFELILVISLLFYTAFTISKYTLHSTRPVIQIIKFVISVIVVIFMA
jgi:hypothetical protein